MTKSFKDLVEALKKRSGENQDDDDLKFGNMGGPPRAPGEQKFAEKSYPVDKMINGPNDRQYPGKNTDNVLNARKTKPTDKHNPPVSGGEKERPTQGASKISNPFGFNGNRSQTNANRNANPGDQKIVRLSKSSVQPVDEGEDLQEFIFEDVTSQLDRIAHSGAPGNIKFRDGDNAMVQPAVAERLLKTYHNLNPSNAQKFDSTINQNAAGLLKMMKFAKV